MGGLGRLLDMRGDDRRFATIGVYQIDLNQTEDAYDPEFVELLGRVDDYVKVTPLLPGGPHSNVTEIGDLESDKTLYDRMLQEINPNLPRTEERRVGQECVRPCSSRCLPDPQNKHKIKKKL